MRRALPLLVLAACGNSAAPSDGRSEPSRREPSRVPWVECTESIRAPMEAALLARYHLAKTDERIDGLRCVTVQLATQPALFVELIATEPGADRHRRMLGVLATDGTTELVGLRDASLSWDRLKGAKVSFETVDLDGDHADEIIVHHADPRLDAGAWIDVVVIRGRGLSEISGPRIAHADPDVDDDQCDGALTTERAGPATHLVVTTTHSTGASDHCLAQGRHVFALDVDRLVETP